MVMESPASAGALAGGGECGALIRAFDWARTPLGPIEAWPVALKVLVRQVLHSRQPSMLWWGAGLVQLYNDAAVPLLGNPRHPAALGQRASECWPEAWAVFEPQVRGALERGEPSWNHDQRVPVLREGKLEDACWTFGFSPAFDDAGKIAGTLLVFTDTTQDVHLRRQLEGARKEAELARAELRGIFMQAPVPMCILTGPDYRFTLANKPYLDLVRREVLGKTLAEAFSPAEAGYYRGLMDEMFRTGEPVTVREAPLQLVDSAGVPGDAYIDLALRPYHDIDGRIVGALAVLLDVTVPVTARKRVEQLAADLQAARKGVEDALAKLDQMFESAPVFIALLRTPAHVFELANPAYHRVIGKRELLGRTVREALPESEGLGFLALLDRVYATGEPFVGSEFPIRLLRAPGGPEEEAFVSFTYEAFRAAGGAIDGVMVFGFDVTDMVLARRRIEELATQQARARERAEAMVEALERAVRERRTLAEAIEQSGDFVGMAQPDGTPILLNQSGRQLVGLSPGEDISRRRFLEFFPADLQARVGGEVLNSVAFTGHWQGELAFQHFVTGERIAVWYTLFAVRDTRGAVIALGTVTRDIRPQKALEAERAAALEREQSLRHAAEAGGRARDEFLAMLGHELRNPLAPIATAVQLMKLRGDHHQGERLVIERQVKHLSRLLDDLLDVARIARGQIDLQRKSVEIREVATAAIEMASPLLEQRAQALTVDVPETGLPVDGDPIRLTQVLANLLNNAARYTPPRGQIQLLAAREGAEVVISVRDDGPGIQPDLLPRIFDLFVQGHRTFDRAEGGLGLGLALVKNLVTLHGGSVAVKNRTPRGSEFSVRLPLLDAAVQQGLAAASGALAATRAPRRVLLVDDNEDAADLLAELLRSVGHDVRVAHDGPQALETLRSFAAEVGLLDIGLPVMDGFELARRIRQQDGAKPLRLIAVTGYGQAHDRARTRSAGFDRHLTKPVDLDALIAAIEA